MTCAVLESVTTNAPPESSASRKKPLKTSSLYRSLTGCCAQIAGSDATAYSASKSSGRSGRSWTSRPLNVGCRSKGIAVNRMNHGRPRVLPLQTVDRGRAGARLLDDDRGGADARPLRGSAGRVGTPAGNRVVVRRSTDVRLAQLNHVFAQGVLRLRAAEDQIP